MKSLQEYTNEQKFNNYLQFVQESLDNNIRMINEAQLIVDHGKDIDNLLYKTRQYFNNHIHNRINESENDYKFTLSEQEAVRDLLIFVCEDYKEKLLNECSIYEGLLNNTISINEASFQLGAVVQNLWKQGKDKVEKIYNDAKTKISELNELIKAFANKAISSLKEFANKIVNFLEDVIKDSLFKVAEKIGFGKDKVVEISDELIDDIKANPEKVTKNDIYESLGNEILKEGVVDWVQNSKAGKWYSEKKQKPLWNAFFQFCNWLLVCKVLPMVVLAVFPGGLVYYIISIAVKVIWNIKKLKGLIKQTQDYIHSWNTYGTWEKIWRGASLLFVWGMWFYNVMSIAGNASKVFDSLKEALKSGKFWEMMWGQAHTGIEPDKMEAMGAAIIRWMGKGFSGSISDAYKEIMDACKEITGQEAFEAAKKAVEAGKSAAEAAKKTMEDTESLTKEIESEVKNFDGDKSTSLLKKIKALCKLTPEELKDKLTYRVWVDGTATTKAAWLKKLIEDAKAAGMDESVLQKTQDMLNSTLHAVNNDAGSVSFMELPGEMIKFASNKGLLGKNGWFGIVGEIAKSVVTGGGGLPAVVASFSAAMASDVPIITFKQKGNGFRVRLGDEKSKNYIYEVGKDDVQFVKQSEINDDKVKKAYETIKKVIHDENVKLIEKMKKSDINEEQKKALDKKLEDFESQYKDNLKKTPIVVISGKRISEDEQKKYDGKESLISLYNYLVTEAEEESKDNKYSVKDLLNNLTELRRHFEKVIKNTPVKQENEENHKKDKTSQKDTFKGNTQLMLRAIFKTNKSVDKESGKEINSTANFVYKKDWECKPYKTIMQRVRDTKSENDKFNDDDLGIPAAYLSLIYNNEKYCEELQGVFIDVLIIKASILKIDKNTKIDDIPDEERKKIIASYKEMVDHLKQSDKFQSQIDNKEWVPLEFNESIDDKDKEPVKKTEEINTADITPEKVEQTLSDAGADTSEPNPEESSEESQDKPQEEPEVEDDDKDHPVLIFSNVYGMDIDKANENGPRKEIYSLKGSFHSLEFIEIKKGMNKADIQEMLGEWMYTMVNNLNALTVELPFEKKKNWWKDKFIVNKNLTENDERKDFGNLTNGEIADIMNKKENAKNYVLTKTNSIIIAQSEKDKKFVEKKKKEYTEKLDNLSDEQKEIIKQIDPKAIGDDGKIDPKKKEEFSDKLAGYKLAQEQATRDKKKKGLLSKLKSFVKGLFGGDKDEGKKYNSLLKTFNEDTNESLTINYNEFLEWCFKPMTLQEFINERKL